MDQQASKKIELNLDIAPVYNKLSHKKWWAILIIAIILLVLIFVDLNIGSANQNIFELISSAISSPDKSSLIVLLNLRLPHVLCAIICGATLGICGCILQSSLGNPLASPSTIGISQGAACGACIAIIAFGGLAIGGQALVILCAFIFALIPTLIIFAISKFKNLSATSIILTGIAMSIFFAGIIALVQYFADSSKVAEVVFWTFGSVYNAGYQEIIFMVIIFLLVFIFASFNFLNYNAMECGDMTAHSIGLNVKNTRLINLIVAAIAAACMTAFCGTINFIGLISPHIMRKFVGSNYKYLIPASAICGAAILVLSDIISSVLLPGAILPIGAITSFVGAPIFIWILIRKKSL